MAVDTFIDRMRRRQVDVMLSTCIVRRPQPIGDDLDEQTIDGLDVEVQVPPVTTVVYTGRCNPMPDGRQSTVERRVEHADAQETIHLYRVKFPHDAGPFLPDDLVEITSSKDPSFVGVTLQITDVERSDYQVAHVVNAIEYLR